MLLVHSYGKVASTSLNAMLAGAFGEVFYSHGIQPATSRMIDAHFEHAPREGGMWNVASQIPAIRRRLAQACAAGEEVTVFTGLRDPITRSLSGTMQLLPHVFSDLVTKDPDETAVKLATYVAEIWRSPHRGADPAQGLAAWGLRAPLFWLAEEIEQPFGFDLTSTFFDQDQGYGILQSRNIRLALFRQENAQVALPAMLRELYPDREIPMSRENLAEGKEAFYRQVYESLQACFRLPADLLRSIYSNKYVRHYYSGEHADRSIARWAAH